MNGIFECSVASTRAEATAFTLDGGDCQPGSVTPDVEYESSLTDIMVFVETDSSGVQRDPGGLAQGFVDLDLGSSPAGGPLLYLPTAQAGWWNIPNLSEPNPAARPPAPPCRTLRFAHF